MKQEKSLGTASINKVGIKALQATDHSTANYLALSPFFFLVDC